MGTVKKKSSKQKERKKHMTQIDKARALSWIEEGVTHKEAARRLGVSISSISRLVSSYKMSAPGVLVPARKQGSGRPRKVSNRILMKIKQDITQNPFLTARQIKNKNPRLMQEISLRTVRWVLFKDLKLPSRVAAKKPLVTNRMRAQRIAFALKYRNWKTKDWKQVIFSDESIFRTTQATKGRCVRRSRNSLLKNETIKQ
jgi:transposase